MDLLLFHLKHQFYDRRNRDKMCNNFLNCCLDKSEHLLKKKKKLNLLFCFKFNNIIHKYNIFLKILGMNNGKLNII